MAAPTIYYVDSDIGTDTGAGTTGDPYGNIQHALDSVTRDAANGDRFKGKGGDVLSASLDLTSYGAPAYNVPLIFDKWNAVWDLDGNDGNFSIMSAAAGLHFLNLKLHNTGTATVVGIGQHSSIQGCEIANSSGNGADLTSYSAFIGNHVHDIGGYGVTTDYRLNVFGNYFRNDGTHDFTAAIYANTECAIVRNIISIDGASDGILRPYFATLVAFNSILSAGGTGVGIKDLTLSRLITGIVNNLVEGFSGAGGVGIQSKGSVSPAAAYGYNALYNNTLNYDVDYDRVINSLGDDETLGSSPFAKSGSDTFANRFNYFAPLNVDNVQGGAWPSGCRLDKGAVQHADPSGGSVNTPALSVADKRDGTGATATISNSTTGTTNTVFTSPWPGDSFSQSGQRTGDGDVNLSLTVGPHWAYVTSVLGDAFAFSDMVQFRATDASNAVLYRALVAVRDVIQGLSLSGIDNNDIVWRKVPWDREIDHPGIIVSPTKEALQPASNLRDDVDYPIMVTMIRVSNQHFTGGMDVFTLWRQQIRRALNRKALSGVPEVYTTRVEHGSVILPEAFSRMYDVGALLVHCIAREPNSVT